MSSLALPPTLEMRLRAIRARRRTSRLAGLIKASLWFAGIAGVVSMAGGALIGSR